MARRMRMCWVLGVTVYVGLLFLLFAGSKNSTVAVFQMTELTPRVGSLGDAMPANSSAFDTLLDREYFVNVFGMTNAPLDIDLQDIDINNAPVPPIAFLFPFVLFILLTHSRRLIEKVYTYFAFPVF